MQNAKNCLVLAVFDGNYTRIMYILLISESFDIIFDKI